MAQNNSARIYSDILLEKLGRVVGFVVFISVLSSYDAT